MGKVVNLAIHVKLNNSIVKGLVQAGEQYGCVMSQRSLENLGGRDLHPK